VHLGHNHYKNTNDCVTKYEGFDATLKRASRHIDHHTPGPLIHGEHAAGNGCVDVVNERPVRGSKAHRSAPIGYPGVLEQSVEISRRLRLAPTGSITELTAAPFEQRMTMPRLRAALFFAQEPAVAQEQADDAVADDHGTPVFFPPAETTAAMPTTQLSSPGDDAIGDVEWSSAVAQQANHADQHFFGRERLGDVSRRRAGSP
jgi:hypothetical protein